MRALVLLVALLPASLAAQSPACAVPENDAFDFWVGEWTVTNPAGQQVGENRITEILGNCVLLEEWTGRSGSVGKSFNIYDAARGVWHQTWVDNGGTLLQLDGRLENGAMVLMGERPDTAGRPILQRITWTPLPDGRVRQLWETSIDAYTWAAVFDGFYSRKE